MQMNWFCVVNDLRAIIGRFFEVCRKRGLKINAGKSKVMVMNGEEGLEREARLEHVPEFRYLECVLDEEGGEWEEGGRCHLGP